MRKILCSLLACLLLFSLIPPALAVPPPNGEGIEQIVYCVCCLYSAYCCYMCARENWWNRADGGWWW